MSNEPGRGYIEGWPRGPQWLYCLPWWGPGKANPPEWIKQTYNHDFVMTADELPDLRPQDPK